MKELVSAILTTHNREFDIVKRAYDSILYQTYPNIEIIVIDDSDSDFRDRERLKQYVDGLAHKGIQTQIIQHSYSRGACAARNSGIKVAKGEYVSFLDDDDEWIKNKVETMIKAFTHDEIGLVYSDNYVFDDDADTMKKIKRKQHVGNVNHQLMKENFVGSASFPLIRNTMIKQLEGFDEKLESAQDYDMWIRLSRICDFNYVNEALSIYHKNHGVKITNNVSSKIKGIERIIEKNKSYLFEHNEAYYGMFMAVIPYYIVVGRINNAQEVYINCVKRCPYKVLSNIKLGAYILLKACITPTGIRKASIPKE